MITTMHLVVCFKIKLYNFGRESPLRARAYHIIHISPQAEVNDHPTGLGVTCGQYIDTTGHCWISRPNN